MILDDLKTKLYESKEDKEINLVLEELKKRCEIN